jgi:uncharacterized protein involved in tolerance to divalent cations
LKTGEITRFSFSLANIPGMASGFKWQPRVTYNQHIKLVRKARSECLSENLNLVDRLEDQSIYQ